jgi:ubiquinone/menaquinone biosynthesis C-methylase UbiE
MGWFTRLFRRPGSALRGRPEDLWRELIARHAPAKSFVDVGCMWRVSGDYAFWAHERGAARVTGVDVDPATPEFHAKNATVGNAVRFLQTDLMAPTFDGVVGTHDLVFCSGVLYHLPDPIMGLVQLRRICGERLILTTASMPERAEPHAAILLPYMDDEARERLRYISRRLGRKVGLDTPFAAERGYVNWFWLPSPSCVRAMAQVAGFDVQELHVHWRVTTVVATPRARA